MLDQGYVTPISLHYDRNHGKCPNIAWGEHRRTVKGALDKPMTFTMKKLIQLPRPLSPSPWSVPTITARRRK